MLTSILTWVALGFVAGLLAKWIMPGDDPGGILITILLGIGGAVVGGFVGTMIGLGDVEGFDFRSILLSIGGALLILFVYRQIKKRKAIGGGDDKPKLEG